MSDELEPATVSGMIIEGPFSSPQEAQRAMADALLLLRQGHEAQQEARGLLEIARLRGAAELLGFESWEDCLAAGISDTLGLKIPQSERITVAARLRMEGHSVRDIAEKTFVNPATTMRDLSVGREIGLLDDEPVVAARDGKSYPARRPTAEPASAPEAEDDDNVEADEPATAAAVPPVQRKPPRRPDLYRSWRNRTDELARIGRSLASMREDDRYPQRLEDLSQGTAHDVRIVHELLAAILQDFAITDKD